MILVQTIVPIIMPENREYLLLENNKIKNIRERRGKISKNEFVIISYILT